MALHTSRVVLTTDWQVVSNGNATVLLSPVGPGIVEFAVVDAIGDITADDPGHFLPSVMRHGEALIHLTGLGTKDVVARTNESGVDAGVRVAVTGFTPA